MRLPTEINVPEAQPPQATRQSRRIQGLVPFDPYDRNSVGPSIQNTKPSYTSSDVQSQTSHQSCYIPNVSSASSSQFSKPMSKTPSAITMQRNNNERIHTPKIATGVPLYYDPSHNQMNYQYPDRHQMQFAQPPPTQTGYYAPYPTYSKPIYDDVTIISLAAPSSLSEPSSHTTHNIETNNKLTAAKATP